MASLSEPQTDEVDLGRQIQQAYQQHDSGQYAQAREACESIYARDAYRTDNLLLLGAIHFQLRNFSESIFYNQQCIRIDPDFAEAYSNLGNALKELGDIDGAIQFYLKAIKLKPRFCDAYNNLASAYMQLGQTKQATETYRMALVLNPALVDAHANLGNLFKAQGRLEDSKRSYLEAIKIKPDFAIAWNNLAGVFKDEGQLETAIAYYQEAIRLAPEFADAHSNLGNALKESKKMEDAVKSYKMAIELRPDFAIAHGNLASCLYDQGNMTAAIRTFKHAIQLEPNFPDAYNNLGNALRESGKLEEAINCYRTALRLKPDHPHAYNNLGNALKDNGMIKEAIHCYMTAARLMPKFAAAHSNLGSILKEQGKTDQALAHYQEAVQIDPLFADGYSNMGNAYKDLNRLDDAIKCYTTAIRIDPGFADAYSNLASAYKDGGMVNDAIKCYMKALKLKPNFPDAFANFVHSLVFVCHWKNRAAEFKKMSSMLEEQLADPNCLPSVQPFHALVYPLSLDELRAISRKHAERAKINVALLEMPPFRFRAKQPDHRLKIGYVSSDFGNHPLAHLMQSVFRMHDRTKYEIYCYSLSANDKSEWRRKIEADAEHFVDLSEMLNGDAARQVHNDGINILINLNGYTKGARNEIFALQPAPIQASYMGFCGTLAADYIQYMIADPIVIPKEFRDGYTESICYMPDCYFVNDHKQSARDTLDVNRCPTRAAYNIPEEKFVFATFNQTYKISPEIFDVWMKILNRVPNSILWLLRFPEISERNLIAEAKERGIKPNRLHFTDVAPKEEHLKRGFLADLFLDTAECNAHTTGCDSLWSGTPMITLCGKKMASRVGASLLSAAELPELITHTTEEYEELAVTLALDMDKLYDLRKQLMKKRESCPLFDTQRWVNNVEKGYDMIWEKHESGEAPGDVVVSNE
jgi:protein O-GlcNAc transferase